jgi:hypothetical protein
MVEGSAKQRRLGAVSPTLPFTALGRRNPRHSGEMSSIAAANLARILAGTCRSASTLSRRDVPVPAANNDPGS